MNANGITRKPYHLPPSPAQNSQGEVCAELRQIIQRIRALTSDSILRRSQLKNKCGRAHSTTHVDIANGVFPPAFSIGVRAVGFSANEIDAWIAARLFASRTKTPVDMKAFVTLLVQSREQIAPAWAEGREA